MRYIAIDVETTGLDPDHCQLLHLAAVAETWPLEMAPAPENLLRFEGLIWHKHIVGESVALRMNADLVALLEDSEAPSPLGTPIHFRDRVVGLYAHGNDLFQFFQQFLRHLGWHPPYVAAGRNVAGFDFRFLPPHVTKLFHHRILDVSSMAMGSRQHFWEGDCLPSAEMLLPEPPERKHDALDDALNVVRAIRHLYRREP